MVRIGDLLPDAARGLGLEDELRLSRAMATFEPLVAERVPAAAGACRVLRIDGFAVDRRGRRADRRPGAPPPHAELLAAFAAVAGGHRRPRAAGARPARRSPAYNPAHLPAISGRRVPIEPGSASPPSRAAHRAPAPADHERPAWPSDSR